MELLLNSDNTSNVLKFINKYLTLGNSRYENDFIELEKINSGAFGAVYKAIHKNDEIIYAIKKIPIDSPKLLINNEAKILAKLNHQNIVRYFSTWIEIGNNINKNFLDVDSYSLGSIDSGRELVVYDNLNYCGVIYIQIELCEFSLKDYLLGCKLNIEQIKIIINSILDGVSYIHGQNIVHCDLSIKNILVVNGIIKICDFGLSERLVNNIIIKDKQCGTEIYKAPEILSKNIYSVKSDIYALGIIFFEILGNFGTEMERVMMIKKLKNRKIKLYYIDIIYMMIRNNPNKRLSIENVMEKILRL
jgi:translation initiation factor 2-alpha kinase 4